MKSAPSAARKVIAVPALAAVVVAAALRAKPAASYHQSAVAAAPE